MLTCSAVSSSHLTQRGLQRRDQGVPQLVQGSSAAALPIPRAASEAARLRGAGLSRSRAALQTAQGPGFDRCLGLGRHRLRVDPVRVEGILQKEACVLDERELRILIFGNEALQRQHPADLRQLAQAFGEAAGPGQGCPSSTSIVFGLVSGSFIRVEQCRNRFGVLRPQIERIEVEAQSCKQRQAKNCGTPASRRRSSCAAVPGNGPRARARHDRSAAGSPGRLEHGEQGGEQSDRGCRTR